MSGKMKIEDVSKDYEYIGRFEIEEEEIHDLYDKYAHFRLCLKEWIERIGCSDIPMKDVVCLEKDEYFYCPENEKPRLIFGFMIYRQSKKRPMKRISEIVSGLLKLFHTGNREQRQ